MLAFLSNCAVHRAVIGCRDDQIGAKQSFWHMAFAGCRYRFLPDFGTDLRCNYFKRSAKVQQGRDSPAGNGAAAENLNLLAFKRNK
jgi:hypothetical protein